MYVPCTSDYVSNSADINASVLGTDKVPSAVFTPAGLAYISNEIEQHFSDPEPEDFELVESPESGWEAEKEMLSDNETADEKEPYKQSVDDEWDDPKEATEDEKWDENEEEW